MFTGVCYFLFHSEMQNWADRQIPGDTVRLRHFGDEGLGPHPLAELLCHPKETISPLCHPMQTVPSSGRPPSTKRVLLLAQQGSSLGQDYMISLEYVLVQEKKHPLIQTKNWGNK